MWPFRRSALALLTSVAAAQGGCEAEVAPPRAQWVVTVSTDAPIPQFGDRILIEVVNQDGEACASCRRLLDGSDPAAFPLSFGVLPTGEALRVRTRLLRAATLGAGAEPAAGTTIDQIVPLGEDVREVSIRLATVCYGIDANLEADSTCDPDSGSVGPSSEIAVDESPLAVGSWPDSLPLSCDDEPPAGTICVPGGAFLLGDAAAVSYGSEEEQVARERVVRVSPFVMDTHELTVGEYLGLKDEFPQLDEPFKTGAAGSLAEFCSYRGPGNDTTAAFSLNCLDKRLAEDICESRQMRLPTEAEWEWAAGNGPLETTFPWGADDAVCDYAVVAREKVYPAQCTNTEAGTLPSGPVISDGRDQTMAGIFDMGGNLEEWVADNFEPYGEACWEALHLNDPQCEGVPGSASVRGGHWANVPLEARVVRRTAGISIDVSQYRGVRCAKSAR